ncbi:MAG: SRPBCC family protein [Candidatus Krumholzibacteriia bacterium]
MTTDQPLKVIAQMLIRRPAAEVYAAFVDPAITTNFWFTRSSGPLEPGARVTWEWEMYGAAADVEVRIMEPDARIVIVWGDPAQSVEWTFDARDDGTTLVKIACWGFAGDPDTTVALALDAMGGFTSLLAGLKAWLEHGVRLNLVADNHPDAQVRDCE